jgi:hypothetical protein
MGGDGVNTGTGGGPGTGGNAGAPPASACAGGFEHRRSIVIEPVADEAVEDVPVLVALDPAWFDDDDRAAMQAGGGLLFLSEAGVPLAFELDSFPNDQSTTEMADDAPGGSDASSDEMALVSTQGDVLVWVAVPQIPPAGETLQLTLCHGGGPTPSSKQMANPWPERSVVMHFSNGLNESSAADYQAWFGPDTLTPKFESGQLGRAITLGGRETEERVHLPGIGSPGGGLQVVGGGSQFSVVFASKSRNGNGKAWMFAFSPDQEIRVDGKKLFGDPNPNHFMLSLHSNRRGLTFYSRTEGYQVQIADSTVSGIEAVAFDVMDETDTSVIEGEAWHYVVTTVDLEKETIEFFVDGQKQGTKYVNVDLFRKAYPEGVVPWTAAIGSYGPGGSGHYKGAIDEFRFWQTAVNEAWVKTTYANVVNPRAFAKVSEDLAK